MANFQIGDIVRVTSPEVDEESLGIGKIIGNAWFDGGFKIQIYSYFEPLEIPVGSCHTTTEKERKEYFKDLLRG